MQKFIQGFLSERVTWLSFDGFTSGPTPTRTDIPQGSPLSPILFLVFASGLLEQIEGENGAVGLGFVDDTNIIVWGRSAEENCRRLDQIHERCLAWARRHGAAFAPKKYKLIHFTRRRKADVTARTNIQGFDGKPVSSLRVLGVWVDSKLRWSSHIARAAEKGGTQLEALSRLVGSTWGLTFARARTLYTAVIWPTITYGCGIWAGGEKGKGLPEH